MKTIQDVELRHCVQWAMFGAFFKSGYTCRTTVIFGTLKDGCLEINSLALNNCFSYRNVFQNGVNALSEMVLKPPFFLCQQAQNFVLLGP